MAIRRLQPLTIFMASVLCCAVILLLACESKTQQPSATAPASAPATKAISTTQPASAAPVALADRLGCSHAGGVYNFTDKDYLNEGADQILATGMRVIKVYLYKPQMAYRFNSDWLEIGNPLEVVAHPYFRELFDKPFTTFILTVYALKDGRPFPWKKSFSQADAESVKRQMHDLTRYLLETYRGTHKTFIIQNWEGDWAAREGFGTFEVDDPKPDVFERMTLWLNARQAGVEQARAEISETDVKVYHACEVNLVALAMKGRPTVTNNVVPNTRCDLYSYSAYDSIKRAARNRDKGRKRFLEALNYLADKAPDSPAFGSKNVYIGEFGHPEIPTPVVPDHSTEKAMNVIRMTTETAIEWGCPYIVYWQVYDNESDVRDKRPDNSQVRGFYLIKPDGTNAPARDYFMSLLK